MSEQVSSPLDVLRDAEGAVIDVAAGDGPYVDEYRRALADVEKLVEAARRTASFYPHEGREVKAALVPFGEWSEDELLGTA